MMVMMIIQAPEPEVAVRSIHVSPDGSQVVAANNKGRCYVWKLAPDSKFEPLTHIDAHKSYILKVLYSPDAKYATLDHIHQYHIVFLYPPVLPTICWSGYWRRARQTRLSSCGARRTTSCSRPFR